MDLPRKLEWTRDAMLTLKEMHSSEEAQIHLNNEKEGNKESMRSDKIKFVELKLEYNSDSGLVDEDEEGSNYWVVSNRRVSNAAANIDMNLKKGKVKYAPTSEKKCRMKSDKNGTIEKQFINKVKNEIPSTVDDTVDIDFKDLVVRFRSNKFTVYPSQNSYYTNGKCMNLLEDEINISNTTDVIKTCLKEQRKRFIPERHNSNLYLGYLSSENSDKKKDLKHREIQIEKHKDALEFDMKTLAVKYTSDTCTNEIEEEGSKDLPETNHNEKTSDFVEHRVTKDWIIIEKQDLGWYENSNKTDDETIEIDFTKLSAKYISNIIKKNTHVMQLLRNR